MRVWKMLLALCLTVAAVWACSGKEEKTDMGVVPEFVLTYAEDQAEDYPTSQGAYRFARLVKERSGGKIEIHGESTT